MNKPIIATAFTLGALAILWIASIFLGTDTLALMITLVIGGVYLLGFYELQQFRHATASLTSALNGISQPVANLSQWLQQLHPSLRTATQARIEGERAALPAPVLTPYLVGLLVMLGLLGTFVGMVSTLQGSVITLQQADDIQAMREGLAAPISGLSLAFGTSVAGVAASAMLGLILTLSRRERIRQAQRLDQHIASDFRSFSLVHNRQQTYQALQAQAQALPQVAQTMSLMSERLATMGEQLSATLTDNQEQFQQSVEQRFTQLANAVESSLQKTIEHSGARTAEVVEPIMQRAADSLSTQLSDNAKQLHHKLQDSNASQAQTLSNQLTRHLEQWQQQQTTTDEARLETFSATLHSANQQAHEQQASASSSFQQQLTEIGNQQQQQTSQLLDNITSLLEKSDKLIEVRQAAESQWLQQHTDGITSINNALEQHLSALRNEEQQRAEAAISRLADLEATVSEHLGKLGSELEAPMTRLIETASEAPKAAAEVITQLRAEISNNIERDNQLLAERETLMQQLNTLATALEQSSGNYNTILEQLVDRSTDTLKTVAESFDSKVASETEKMSTMAAEFAASASEMASLGDAFSAAVENFNAANVQVVESLAHIEQALEQSSLRSDEQLGYYVAQAREIIDHSILSQKQMLEELRQLGQQEQLFAEAN